MFIKRHKTFEVDVGGVKIGGSNPIVIQSMTNTDTSDVASTVKQIIELHEAGSEIVRVTVNNDEAAKAIYQIKNELEKKNYSVPISGCFHYNGHRLLSEYKDCAQLLDKYRINPGNVGFASKRDTNFEKFIEVALEFNKPIRIGVNWGSIDQDLATRLMDENSKKQIPASSQDVMLETLVESALGSAKKAEQIGLASNKIIISCKTSSIPELVHTYRMLAKKSNYALHLGLTEAGMGLKGAVATSSALAILLSEGIGDTIRASITPEPDSSRTEEVKLCLQVLQALKIRNFSPEVSACPGCGRTTSSFFQSLAMQIQNFLDNNMPIWKKTYPNAKNLKVAVMGCIVNGPGESKHANIGISLPGTGEKPIAPVFVDGEKLYTLRGEGIAEEFMLIIEDYIKKM
jgi:(E)-4-hydroxy-3-methylbut-2-enyl-diphosphate synthase